MASAMMEVLCFGEILLRLSAPNRELLLQSPHLTIKVGGAEANVAVGLANLGHRVGVASVVPDSSLGRAAIGELSRYRVDVSNIKLCRNTNPPSRMGLYFMEAGAGQRASNIIYDRTHSAFADAAQDSFDWPTILTGVKRLHLSGITPALGNNAFSHAFAAALAAREAGVAISFDGNYRASLWDAWDSNPRASLTKLIAHADILFGNHKDISLLLGHQFTSTGATRRREAALAAFNAFPQLKLVASTSRDIVSTDTHHVAARIDSRENAWQTEPAFVSNIVDRIGAGDAFAAGVLHGYLNGCHEQDMLNFGLALTCLKHSLPGDASLFKQADIDLFLVGNKDVRR
jgi:2-dehydro-3-deoxygluconokinase